MSGVKSAGGGLIARRPVVLRKVLSFVLVLVFGVGLPSSNHPWMSSALGTQVLPHDQSIDLSGLDADSLRPLVEMHIASLLAGSACH